MFKRILIVCVGNICRSPTAEYLLRQRLDDATFEVSSAGLSAVVDHPAESSADGVMGDHGVDAGAHRARQLTVELLREADLVLVMEPSHIPGVRRMAPEASGKVFLLGKWIGDTPIPDPFRKQRIVFEEVYELIERSVDAWLPHLQSTGPLKSR